METANGKRAPYDLTLNLQIKSFLQDRRHE